VSTREGEWAETVLRVCRVLEPYFNDGGMATSLERDRLALSPDIDACKEPAAWQSDDDYATWHARVRAHAEEISSQDPLAYETHRDLARTRKDRDDDQRMWAAEEMHHTAVGMPGS